MNHIGDMENIGADHNTPLDTMVMIKKSETTDLMDYEVTGHQGPGGYNFEVKIRWIQQSYQWFIQII